ncbi:hypothetical protein KEJ29_02655 [Candidatus Bathyarchaeota archaeon]|nr:hypothetical protein [Candidatus Bathyarchaeota archaeon]
MSFEIQDLVDILRILTLVELGEKPILKRSLERKICRICKGRFNIDVEDFNEMLKSMVEEGLISVSGDYVKLTDKGAGIGREWRKFLFKGEPILEIIAGIADGTVASLTLILSSLIAGLSMKMTLIASILSLIIVSITNFSSFLLGGITENLADLTTLQNLIIYSLSDIPDSVERTKAIHLARELLNLLRRERSKMSILSALACGGATFASAAVPLAIYLSLPQPIDMILSLSIILAMAGIFLVYYRALKMRIHWKITLLQTITVIAGVLIMSLLLSTNI